MDKHFIKIIDALIKKYSSKEMQHAGCSNCPLCAHFELDCEKCPNSFFHTSVGCASRAVDYPALDYTQFNKYPTLKQFWINYKELYLTGMSNDEIMTKLILKLKEK